MNGVDDGDHSSLEEDADTYKEQLEAVFFKLKESKSYRRTVESISMMNVKHLRKSKNPINRRQEPGRS
ncbi:hypothetical protein Tco_1265263 [Tanacetum coccineum]